MDFDYFSYFDIVKEWNKKVELFKTIKSCGFIDTKLKWVKYKIWNNSSSNLAE